MIYVETIENFFKWYLGCNPYGPLTAADWLSFSEHKLLAVTRGKVFHDGLGELEDIRQKFHYYPRDVWLYQLAAQWIKIFEDREFISRCGDVGDELGSMVIAARQVNRLMRLCFLMERKYAPYTKWFGNCFHRAGMCFRTGPDLQGCARVVDVERAGKQPGEGLPRNRADAQCLEHHAADSRRCKQLSPTTLHRL